MSEVKGAGFAILDKNKEVRRICLTQEEANLARNICTRIYPGPIEVVPITYQAVENG